MYCPDHGDFFVQRLRNERPVVFFKAFDSDTTMRVTPNMSTSAENHGQSYRIRCDQTGVIFDSILKASQEMGLNKTSIAKHINPRYPGVRTVSGYTFTRLDEKNQMIIQTEPINKKVKIRCNQTGVIFESVRAASERMSLRRERIRQHVNHPEIVRHVQGFTFSKVRDSA